MWRAGAIPPWGAGPRALSPVVLAGHSSPTVGRPSGLRGSAEAGGGPAAWAEHSGGVLAPRGLWCLWVPRPCPGGLVRSCYSPRAQASAPPSTLTRAHAALRRLCEACRRVCSVELCFLRVARGCSPRAPWRPTRWRLQEVLPAGPQPGGSGWPLPPGEALNGVRSGGWGLPWCRPWGLLLAV